MAWCGLGVCAAWWCVAAAANCDVTMDGLAYREEVLVAPVHSATGLAVNFHESTLYFTFLNHPYRNAKVDLKRKVFSAIDELGGWCHFTVDQARGYVHAGCDIEGGLFAWDSHPARFVVEGEKGKEVRFAHYYNKTLFYSLDDDGLLRTFVKGHSALVPGLSSDVHGLVVAARGDFVFYNWTGVYRQRRDRSTRRIEGFSDIGVWGLAVDGRGAAYVCSLLTPRGIWRVHDGAPDATLLLDAGCTGLAFDADDNMIYADYDRARVVRLLPCQPPGDLTSTLVHK